MALLLNYVLGGHINNLFIQFNGIKVSGENRIFIENCFQSIFHLSPSDSSVSFNFFKTNEGFSGNILIVSQAKIFEADCDEVSIRKVMKVLSKKVHQQLSEWKNSRFKIA